MVVVELSSFHLQISVVVVAVVGVVI